MSKRAIVRSFAVLAMALLAAPAFLSAAGRASAAKDDTVDQVIDKYLTALGGREALSKITSRRATGVVTVNTPAGDVSGPITITNKAPNKTRAQMELDLTALGAGSMTVEQVFDGTHAWSLNSMQGNQAIEGAQLANMKNALFPTPLLNVKAWGAVTLAPRETINGKPCIVLVTNPNDGPAAKIYLDAQTYLTVRTVSTVDNPNGGSMQAMSEPSDYRVVDGVKVPFLIANANDIQTLTIKLAKVEHNIAVADDFFVVK